MKLEFCAVCGTTEGLHQHHIQPVIQTGIKRTKKKGYRSDKLLKDCDSLEIFAFLFDQGVISDDGQITVCDYHHNILHGIMKFQLANHSNLIKKGIEKARESGTQLGRPSKVDDLMILEVINLRNAGMPIRKIAENLGIGTVYSCISSS